MRLYRLEQRQLLPICLDDAWDFFGNPGNLPLITPTDLEFTITSPLPDRMHAGMIITYTVTPFGGMKIDWVTEITHARAPDFFVDEQRFGPYRFWHHQHLFTAVAAGTEMTDLVHYALPFGFAGRLAAPFVATRLKGIFDYRRKVLEERFGHVGACR